MSTPDIGVVGLSEKENEHRVAIHPAHIAGIDSALRKRMVFAEGYANSFGVSDSDIAELSCGFVMPKERLLKDCSTIIMPKPTPGELRAVRRGATVWGWPHCVQQREIAQEAIDRELTFIAWESMFTWTEHGQKDMHIFYKNNELAGYAGVNHALSLVGINGNYGELLKAAVISFGSVSRGSIYALQGQGIRDIVVFTNRSCTEVKDQVPGISYFQMKARPDGGVYTDLGSGEVPISQAFADCQVIVNGTMQDVGAPRMFVGAEDKDRLLRGALIIDISCDEGMGFWCARPTTFDDPIFTADGRYYYSVDHSPSYYWQSATWEISKAMLPYLQTVAGDESCWRKDPIVWNSVEILRGRVLNKRILSFQNRESEYPYPLRSGASQ